MLCESCATLHQHDHTERAAGASAAACVSLSAPVSALSSHGKCAAAAQPPQPCTACSNAHIAARLCITAASMPPASHTSPRPQACALPVLLRSHMPAAHLCINQYLHLAALRAHATSCAHRRLRHVRQLPRAAAQLRRCCLLAAVCLSCVDMRSAALVRTCKQHVCATKTTLNCTAHIAVEPRAVRPAPCAQCQCQRSGHMLPAAPPPPPQVTLSPAHVPAPPRAAAQPPAATMSHRRSRETARPGAQLVCVCVRACARARMLRPLCRSPPDPPAPARTPAAPQHLARHSRAPPAAPRARHTRTHHPAPTQPAPTAQQRRRSPPGARLARHLIRAMQARHEHNEARQELLRVFASSLAAP